MLAGLAAEMLGWWIVASRRGSVWLVMPVVLGAMGIGAVLARRPVWAGHVGTPAALGVGAASGLVLYVATRGFVWIASRREPFRMDVAEQYRRAATIPFAEALVLSLAVMVPSEELFWRGLFQPRLGSAGSVAAAAAISWLAYVAANVPSRSSPLIVGAIVGGGLWVALAWWSGGMLASLISHILWTGLMLVLPPGAGRAAEGFA